MLFLRGGRRAASSSRLPFRRRRIRRRAGAENFFRRRGRGTCLHFTAVCRERKDGIFRFRARPSRWRRCGAHARHRGRRCVRAGARRAGRVDALRLYVYDVEGAEGAFPYSPHRRRGRFLCRRRAGRSLRRGGQPAQAHGDTEQPRKRQPRLLRGADRRRHRRGQCRRRRRMPETGRFRRVPHRLRHPSQRRRLPPVFPL